MELKHILVPYDFSECATDALRVAAKLAKLSGAMLHLVHVYEDMGDFHASNQKVR
ncbi:MAG: universal stress protein, partial [Flavobacteriales bacterium]